MLKNLLPIRASGQDVLTTANLAREARAWSLAGPLYETFLARNPGRHDIWVQYGHALKEQGLLVEAEDAYRKSLSIEQSVADTYLQLGHVLKLAGRLGESADAYLLSNQLDPQSPHAAVELAAFWPDASFTPDLRAWDGYPNDERFILETAPLLAGPLGRSDRAGVRSKRTDRRRAYRSIVELLRFNGLNDRFLEIFDHLFYYYTNEDVCRDLNEPTIGGCLMHFCETGIGELLTIREDCRFDPVFYRETYSETSQYSDVLAYRHWLNTGHNSGRHPNKRAWVRSLIDLDIGNGSSSELDKRIGINVFHVTGEKWTDRFKHFIDNDILFESPEVFMLDDGALSMAVAERFVALGNDEAGLRLYERILSQRPSSEASLACGEILQRMGSYLSSAAPRTRKALAGSTQLQSYFQAEQSLKVLGDLKEVVSIWRKCIDLFPANDTALTHFRAAGDSYMMDAWSRAYRIARSGDIAGAQDTVRSACQHLVATTTSKSALPKRTIKSVAIVHVEISAQCILYRVTQKVEHIARAGYRVKVFHENQLDVFLRELPSFDAVIFYRFPAWLSFIYAVERSRQYGLHVFYDIDDLLFSGDFPDTFESYAGLIQRDDHIGLQIGVPLFEEAVKLCDYGLASTTPLAVEMAKRTRTGKAFVHRNAFGAKHAMFASKALDDDRRDDGPIVIFYGSGTTAHGEDFQMLVEPALISVAKKYGKRVQIKLAGYVTPSAAMLEVAQSVSVIPLNWDVEAYWSSLSTADINIAVLKRGPMTDAKSEIKWMEAAMFGVPSVVSRTETYEEVIEDGVSGVLCSTPREWLSALTSLIENRALRRRIGRRAWEVVTTDYGIDRMAKTIDGIFSECQPPVARGAKPTIVVVNVFYPPRPIGGATRVVYDNVTYIRRIHGDEFNIEVFTTEYDRSEDYSVSDYVHDGVRVTAINRPMTAEIEAMVDDPKVGDLFGSFLDRVKPALVHFHCLQRLSVSVVRAANERNIPYVITAHDGWWISRYHFTVDEWGRQHLFDFEDGKSVWDDGGRRAYDKFVAVKAPLFDAKQVIGVSSKFAEIYESCGVPNVVVCANGISRLPATVRTRSPDGRVRLGFVGGLHRVKGYHLIRLALEYRRFENLALTVIDHGLQPGETKSTCWNGTPVTFMAKVPEDEVGTLYSQIDVLLAPSIWPESFGLVTREAVHFGCWVVASKLGSIGDPVVEGENGYLIDVQDADDLIRVLSAIDADADRYLTPPEDPPIDSRGSDDQAEELVRIYRSHLRHAEP